MTKLNRKKVFILIFTLFTIIVFIVLNNYNPSKSNTIENTIDNTIDNTIKNYIGVSMLDKQGNMLPSRNIKLEQDTPLNTTLKISNFIPKDREYMLKIYDNEKFIEFILDGTTSTEHFINLSKGEEKSYNLEINNIQSNSTHNMVLFLIAEPQNSTLSEIERSMGKVITSRFNITTGNGIYQISTSDSTDIKNYYTNSFDESFDFFVTDEKLTNREDNLKILSSLTSHRETDKLYLYLSNTTDNTVQYKIICLKNWDIDEINSKSYLLFTLEPHKEIEIPVDLYIKEIEINNEMIFFCIPSPFESMDDDNIKKLINNYYPIDILNTTRILIR